MTSAGWFTLGSRASAREPGLPGLRPAKSNVTRAVAGAVALKSMTVETDAPYLPPQRIRGQRNEPANVREVAEFVAQLRGTPYETVAEETAKTATRLFGLTADVAERAGGAR